MDAAGNPSPPGKEVAVSTRIAVLAAVLLATLGQPIAAFAQMDTPADPIPVLLAGVADTPIGYHLEGDEGELSTSNDDQSPAAAAGSAGQDLLVWSNVYSSSDRDIQAVYVDHRTGTAVGDPFYVASSSRDEVAPDVAFDSIHNRFLVVWQEASCTPTIPAACGWTVRGRLLYSAHQASGQFPADAFSIASALSTLAPSEDLTNPVAAYNADDGIFFVAFLRSPVATATKSGDVNGQMLRGDTSLPTVLGPSSGFAVLDYDHSLAESVDVAWSDAAAGTFFVAAQVRTDTDNLYVAGAYVMDTYPADEQPRLGSWAIAPHDRGDYPLTNDCFGPSVAYDSDRSAYVVAFGYRQTAGEENLVLYGQRVRADYSSSTFRYDSSYAFPIATSLPFASFSYLGQRIVATGMNMEMGIFYLARWLDLFGSNYVSGFLPLNAMTVGGALAIQSGGASSGRFIALPQAACRGGACTAVWQGKRPLMAGTDLFTRRVWPDCWSLSLQVSPSCSGCAINRTPDNCYTGYRPDTGVSLTAVAGGGYAFSHWGGDAAGSSPAMTVTMDADKSVVAYFEPAAAGHPLYLPLVQK